MIIFPRRAPKLHNGFRVILEDGTLEEILRWRWNGFKAVVDDVVASDDGMVEEEEETSKRKCDDIAATIPMKRVKID